MNQDAGDAMRHPPSRTDAEVVLLAMRPGRDRDLLGDWLASSTAYRVEVVDRVPEDAAYDLCLADRETLRDHEERLREHKAASDPVFLPHVLLGGTEDGKSWTVDAVDDVLDLPVPKGLLHRRLENLLRTRRASRRLREREQQYEQLVDLTPEGIMLVAEGEIRYANRAAGTMLDVPDADELVGRPVAEFAGDAARLRDLLASVTDDETAAGDRTDEFVDVEFVTAAGESVDAVVAGVAVVYDGEPTVQLIVRDLTEERRQERRLALLGRAVESAAQGITVADARREDVPLIYANAAFEHITGYDTAEVIGQNCRFLQGEGTDEETVATIREAIHAEEPVTVELLNYRKDGTPFWNQLDIVPVTDEAGETTHFLGFQRDVTERREREERLTVLNRVLRHNLRNRLNVVQGYTEQLQPATEDGREAVEYIRRSVDELLEITEKVGTFRDVDAGGPSAPEPHDLVSLVERAVEGVRRDHPGATVDLSAPEATTVRGHEMLPMAIVELLDLATREGDDPDIGVRVTVADGGEDRKVTVELVDRGGTIPSAELAVLAADGETTTDHPRGVGVWLLRWVVLRSGGEVTVDRSDPDRPVVRLRFRDRPDA